MKTHQKTWITALAVSLASAVVVQAASTLQFTATSYSVAEDAGTVTLTVQRLDDTISVVSVDYATTNGTATAGLKYTAVSGTLTFTGGETNKAIVVPILNEAFVEGTQTFQVVLSNPTGGAVLGNRTTATVRVTDNDTGVQFELGSYSVAEDAGSVLIGVLRGDDGNFPVTVDYATTNVTATAGVDYRETPGTLTFAAGETLKLLAVSILNDSLKEPNETFRLTLSNPTGGGVLGSRMTATVTIVDNDPGVSLEHPKYGVSEQEPSLTVRVLRGNDLELRPLTVDLSTADLTATGGVDYVAIRTNLAFAQGETFKTVDLLALADDLEEPTEQFQLILDNLLGAASLGTSNATVYLFDGTGLTPHRFDALTVLPGGTVELTLGGSVSQALSNDFDLYPIEVSTNLVDWKPWVTLQRTNASTNVFTWQDPDAVGTAARFYSTPVNHFITPYPKPPGPFSVGVVSRLVTDPTRRDRYAKLPGEACFMISVWYPAVAEAGKVPARLEDEALTYGTSSRRNLFRSYAQSDVPCAGVEAPYPILAYSPGGWGLRTEVAERGPYLASYGYVVVAADPIDVPSTVFPDRTVLFGRSDAVLTGSGFQDRVRDVQVVLDELARWNMGDPLFKGRLDVANVAVAGWSWGEGVAAEACRIDARCRALLSFEGYFQNAGTVLSTGLSKPILSMYAASLYDAGAATTLHNKATRDSIWFQIRSTVHESFSDYYWNDYPKGGREAAAVLNTYTLWFLDKYLKGRNDPVPDPNDYPRIFNYKQK